MRQESSRCWLLPFAVATTCSLGATERQHSHNKHFCNNTGDQASWDQFVSQAVLHQARCIFNAAKQSDEPGQEQPARPELQQQQLPLLLQQQQQHQQQQQQQQLQLQQQQQQQKTEPRLKARSPKELYKNDFLDKLMAKRESRSLSRLASSGKTSGRLGKTSTTSASRSTRTWRRWRRPLRSIIARCQSQRPRPRPRPRQQRGSPCLLPQRLHPRLQPLRCQRHRQRTNRVMVVQRRKCTRPPMAAHVQLICS